MKYPNYIQRKKQNNLIRGGKGGVGKTFFSRFLASYYDFANRPTELFDADSGNKDLQKYYPKANTQINFDFQSGSNAKGLLNDIADDILDVESDCIINLPANVEGEYFNAKTGGSEPKGIDYWLLNNDLNSSNFLESIELDICHWFVSNGSNESKSFFDYVCQTYGKVHQIILVKNNGVENSWGAPSNPLDSDKEFAQIAKKYCSKNYQELYIDILRTRLSKVLEDNNLKMDELMVYEGLSVAKRGAMGKFLHTSYSALNKILKFREGSFTSTDIINRALELYTKPEQLTDDKSTT